MCLNDVPFLTSASHDSHYGSVIVADDLKCHALELDVIDVIRCHAARGFNAVLITVDIQFKSLKDRNQVGVELNEVSKHEYAPIIEIFHPFCLKPVRILTTSKWRHRGLFSLNCRIKLMLNKVLAIFNGARFRNFPITHRSMRRVL